jgi:hypothetical protein
VQSQFIDTTGEDATIATRANTQSGNDALVAPGSEGILVYVQKLGSFFNCQ